MDSAHENQLIVRVLDGDTEAFEFFVMEYQTPIYNLMLRLTRSPEDAADLTQETFLRAYNKLERFKTNRYFFPWLYSVGMNLARDWNRSNKGKPPTDSLEGMQLGWQGMGQDMVMGKKQELEMVQAALQSLPLEQQEALVLRFKYEMSMKEVAHSMDISLSAAKMRVSRGLAALRELMDGARDGHYEQTP
jgi:RNA polymerase sigma-70 factor (ECF subfamily)